MTPIGIILGLYWGYVWDNGKESGNYNIIMGLYRDNITPIYICISHK